MNKVINSSTALVELLHGHTAEEWVGILALPLPSPLNPRAVNKRELWAKRSGWRRGREAGVARAWKTRNIKAFRVRREGGISRERCELQREWERQKQRGRERERGAGRKGVRPVVTAPLSADIYAWGFPNHLHCQFPIPLIFEWQLTSTPINPHIISGKLPIALDGGWNWRKKVNLFFRRLPTVIAPMSVCLHGKVVN